MINYSINVTLTGALQEFGLSFFLLLLFISLSIISFGSALDWLFIAITICLFRVSIYWLSDFLFKKELSKTETSTFLSMFFLKWRITTRSYLIIENSPLPSKRGNKHYYLVLVRNNNFWLKRVFKNKISLYVEDGNLDLIGIAQKIEQVFQIEYRGIVSINNNEENLMKNKGIIP